MSENLTYNCNACGKNISTGNGRRFMLQTFAVITDLTPGTKATPGIKIPSGHFHVCNFTCLKAFATTMEADENTDIQAAREIIEKSVAANAPKTTSPFPVETIKPPVPKPVE